MKKTLLFSVLFLSLITIVSAISWGSFGLGDDGQVNLTSPTDSFISTTENITFSCSAEILDGNYITNLSLLHNQSGAWVINETFTSLLTGLHVVDDVGGTDSQPTETSKRGIIIYTHQRAVIKNITVNPLVTATRAYIQYSNGTEIANSTITSLVAEFNQALEADTSYRIVVDNETNNWGDDRNTTYPFPRDLGIINITNGSAGGLNDSTLFAVDTLSLIGEPIQASLSKEINITSPLDWSCLASANDSTFGYPQSNRTILGGISSEIITFNISTVESATETYKLNITAYGGLTIEATFIYNGTEYTTTKTTSGDNTVFTNTIDIAQVDSETNKTFYWAMSFNGNPVNSTIKNQTIGIITMSECSIGNSSSYINFNYSDEVSLTAINASLSAATLEYWVDSKENSKTFTYTNTTEVFNNTFCILPSDRTYNVDIYYPYTSTGYPQRIFDPPSTAFTSATTNYTLYLLATVDGIFVTFQVINQAEQLLSDVIVNATRSISGVETVVGSGATGAAGTITFWLNPDFIHTFNFFKSGFDLLVSEFIPDQTSYTITLGGDASQQVNDYTRGITNTILPSTSTELVNETTYAFNYTLASSYWDVDEFGFTLKLQNGTVLQGTSLLSSGGTLNLNQDTINYSRIVMEYYWVINGTSINQTTYWNVFNSANTQWSISNFFTDLNSYLEEDLFGIDDFGRYLIIFLVLFTSIGILSFKYGLNSPVAISSIVFAVVFFFDYATGLLPNPVGAIPNFPTFAAAIILVSLLFREVTR